MRWMSTARRWANWIRQSRSSRTRAVSGGRDRLRRGVRGLEGGLELGAWECVMVGLLFGYRHRLEMTSDREQGTRRDRQKPRRQRRRGLSRLICRRNRDGSCMAIGELNNEIRETQGRGFLHDPSIGCIKRIFAYPSEKVYPALPVVANRCYRQMPDSNVSSMKTSQRGCGA